MSSAEQGDVHDFEVARRDLPDGGVELRVSGELDLATVGGFEVPLTAAIDSPDGKGPVIVDFSACGFVDSAGVRVLIAGARRLAGSGRRLRVTGAREQVRDLFTLIALDDAPAIELEQA
jgi:anti-sigma B factor antagonist